MSKYEVIILAQGNQSRLGMAHGYKQLLPLPACGGMPILARTIRQLRSNLIQDLHITLVATNGLVSAVHPAWWCVDPVIAGANATGLIDRYEELVDPGNSSLKGISRYLGLRGTDHFSIDRTVVLLGDVVYSWHCLHEIFFSPTRTYGFVGTSDLDAGRGELWGVAWHRDYEAMMLSDLAYALVRHPPFEGYQPGQMRRWISGGKRGPLKDHVHAMRRAGHYLDVDDYTRDIDLPEHLALLPKLSESAAADDHVNNAPWSTK